MADKDTPSSPSTIPASYPFVLVVYDMFKTYKREDVIDDPKEIAEIMDTHHDIHDLEKRIARCRVALANIDATIRLT